MAPNFESVTSPNFVRKALLFKESELLRALAARLLSKVSITSKNDDNKLRAIQQDIPIVSAYIFLTDVLCTKVSSQGEDPLEAWNECLDHNTSLAWCHIHRVTLEKFTEAVAECPDPGNKAMMKKVRKNIRY